MQHTELVRPSYAENFHCIGPACEDNCCRGWTIPIEQAATEKFHILQPSPLRTLIDASILLAPPNEDGSKPAIFATIRMNEANTCPLLSDDNHCRIQRECGESFLPHVCATYPRIIYNIAGIEEKALTLSCPEAARVVLLNPALLDAETVVTAEALPTANMGDTKSLKSWFWPIRKFVLSLVLNRAFPLWQRLFLLGIFCRGLDAIAKSELKSTVPAFLRDFENAVTSDTLPATLQTLPVELSQQLDVILRLAGLLLHRSNLHPRFIDCIQAFTAGIGNRAGATLESLTAQYGRAYTRWYEPFFDRNPHILENYLINTILRCQFPFGREAMRSDAAPSLAREHGLLTAQFALMKGFLIGVAGFHCENFSADQVVHTFQSASKHFEHHVEFLDQAHALLVESEMDGDRGAAILLRNDLISSQPTTVSTMPIPHWAPAVDGSVFLPDRYWDARIL